MEVAVDGGVNRDGFAGASAGDGPAGRGRPCSDGPVRPDPGEPPATRPTSPTPREIEFVPQTPTRWLAPKLLVFIGVQVAFSGVLVGEIAFVESTERNRRCCKSSG